jgi:predicted secreted protein
MMAVVAVAAALGACGAVAGPARPGGPTATPSQVVTEADSGKTISLAVGQTAALRLPSRYEWSDPRVSGDAVRVSAGAGAPAAAYREWTIGAVARGTVTVTAAGRPRCTPGDICPGAILAFSIIVSVT